MRLEERLGKTPETTDKRTETMVLIELLRNIEAMLTILLERQTVREWYTTEQAARLLGRAEYTVRAWFKNGRLKAQKRMSGRGAYSAWVVSHAELVRYQREGLLPCRPA